MTGHGIGFEEAIVPVRAIGQFGQTCRATHPRCAYRGDLP